MKIILTIIFALFFLITSNLFGQKKANMEGIEIGNVAPQIELPAIDGNNFKLSQLRGKIVLVNFWASWCSPCRKKAPELIKVFNKYRNLNFADGETGFEVLSVSLDRSDISWKNSIEKDGIDEFRNVGDMKGWKSSAAAAYNIKSIPSSILLDGEGVIIAINLSPKDLNKKLKQMKKRGWFLF